MLNIEELSTRELDEYFEKIWSEIPIEEQEAYTQELTILHQEQETQLEILSDQLSLEDFQAHTIEYIL